jgi:tetratricopeptide (TPR) repeat protein
MGEFNWGSTFWHELAHTFTLGASGHRVPRWLSEGLSVLEERRARGGWGAGVTPDFLAAYKGGLLVPVSRMNDGFMRPRYPMQVIHSYYQASLVCELIERQYGAPALSQMLQAYRDGLTTPEVFQRVLKTDLDAFDKAFARHLDERFAERAKVIGEMRIESDSSGGGRPRMGVRLPTGDQRGAFAQAMARATEAMEAGRDADAARLFAEAKALFPEYTGPGSAYHALAAIHRKRGDAKAATTELRAIVASNESDVAAHSELSELLEQQGDRAGAAEVLERAMYIWPFDPKQHDRLATLYAATGNKAKVVRERRALVALNPVDRAEALYQLALALEQAGDAASARREVLRALEEAPNFEKAQELLLRLPRGSTPEGRGSE